MNSSERKAPTSPVTVVLTDDQIATIDEITALIRRNTGHRINRSAMVRAITSAVLPYYRDLVQCRSESHVAHRVAQRLQVGTK